MAEITWKSILTKLVGGDHLTAEESEWFVDDLMQGNANPAAVGAALAMQQQLGLTADEVRGAAKAMVSHAVPLNVSGGYDFQEDGVTCAGHQLYITAAGEYRPYGDAAEDAANAQLLAEHQENVETLLSRAREIWGLP